MNAATGLRIPAEVRTERLLLRQWRDSDLDSLARIMAQPAVTRHLGDGTPKDRNDSWRQIAIFAGHWALRGYSHWAVELAETGELIGRAGPWYPEGWPSLEIGWVIDPRHQRRGYATEAGREALAAAWTLGHDRVVSYVRPGNQASIAVACKLGGTHSETIELSQGPALVFDYPAPG